MVCEVVIDMMATVVVWCRVPSVFTVIGGLLGPPQSPSPRVASLAPDTTNRYSSCRRAVWAV